jgi:hypothetical protein
MEPLPALLPGPAPPAPPTVTLMMRARSSALTSTAPLVEVMLVPSIWALIELWMSLTLTEAAMAVLPGARPTATVPAPALMRDTSLARMLTLPPALMKWLAVWPTT